jgi:hypothetical protein
MHYNISKVNTKGIYMLFNDNRLWGVMVRGVRVRPEVSIPGKAATAHVHILHERSCDLWLPQI